MLLFNLLPSFWFLRNPNWVIMDCSCSTRPSSLLISSEPSFRFPRSNFSSNLSFQVCLSILMSCFSFDSKSVRNNFKFLGFFFFQIPKDTKLVKQRLVVRSSSGSDQNGDVNGFPLKPNKLFVQEVFQTNSFGTRVVSYVFMGFWWMRRGILMNLLMNCWILGDWSWVWRRVWDF